LREQQPRRCGILVGESPDSAGSESSDSFEQVSQTLRGAAVEFRNRAAGNTSEFGVNSLDPGVVTFLKEKSRNA
jgi:hypothetical protein